MFIPDSRLISVISVEKASMGAYPLKCHMIQHSDDDTLATLTERRKSVHNQNKNPESSALNPLDTADQVKEHNVAPSSYNNNANNIPICKSY